MLTVLVATLSGIAALTAGLGVSSLFTLKGHAVR
jgi:hypothetical protein